MNADLSSFKLEETYLLNAKDIKLVEEWEDERVFRNRYQVSYRFSDTYFSDEFIR
jgi:hypothetical protein